MKEGKTKEIEDEYKMLYTRKTSEKIEFWLTLNEWLKTKVMEGIRKSNQIIVDKLVREVL